MSSTAAAATSSSAVDRRTYWCHECDMSVSLLPSPSSSSSILCPHCRSDFLEQMDSQFPPAISISGADSSLSAVGFIPSSATGPSDDDNYLLDSPYLRRLIHHLNNSDSDDAPPACLRHHSPASRSAVEAIPVIKITPSLLDLDPVLLCAVCKDQFAMDALAKQLPCKHLYHADCILPWLSQHNSCPVCRFQLPVEESPPIRSFEEDMIMIEDQNLFGLGNTLRHIARRHRILVPDLRQSDVVDDANLMGQDFESGSLSVSSPTQVEGAEMGMVEQVDSMETVSSWPSWAAMELEPRGDADT